MAAVLETRAWRILSDNCVWLHFISSRQIRGCSLLSSFFSGTHGRVYRKRAGGNVSSPPSKTAAATTERILPPRTGVALRELVHPCLPRVLFFFFSLFLSSRPSYLPDVRNARATQQNEATKLYRRPVVTCCASV